MTLPPLRPLLILALFGGAVCTFGDYLHARFGVLHYFQPSLGIQAWWVPLLFFFATLSILGPIAPFRSKERQTVSNRTLAASGAAFLLAYTSTSFFHASAGALLFFLIATWWARMIAVGSPRMVALSLLLLVAGPAFEAFWSSLGMFSYDRPEIAGVPCWLGGIYLHIAPFALHLDERFLRT